MIVDIEIKTTLLILENSLSIVSFQFISGSDVSTIGRIESNPLDSTRRLRSSNTTDQSHNSSILICAEDKSEEQSPEVVGRVRMRRFDHKRSSGSGHHSDHHCPYAIS